MVAASVDKKPRIGKSVLVKFIRWTGLIVFGVTAAGLLGLTFGDFSSGIDQAVAVATLTRANGFAPLAEGIRQCARIREGNRGCPHALNMQKVVQYLLKSHGLVLDGSNGAYVLADHIYHRGSFDDDTKCSKAAYGVTGNVCILGAGQAASDVGRESSWNDILSPSNADHVCMSRSNKYRLTCAVSAPSWVFKRAKLMCGRYNHSTARHFLGPAANLRLLVDELLPMLKSPVTLHKTYNAPVYCIGPFTALSLPNTAGGKRNLVILDRETLEMSRKLFHRAVMAPAVHGMASKVDTDVGVARMSRSEVKSCVSKILSSAAKAAMIDGKVGAIAKSCNLLSLGILQGHPEGEEKWDAMCLKRAEALFAEAFKKWDGAKEMLADTIAMNLSDKLEYVKLGAILIAPDGNAEAMPARIADSQKAPRAVDPSTWRAFMNFTYRWDIVKFVQANKRLPCTNGEPLDVAYSNKLLAGSADMGDEASWGKTWIEDEYDFMPEFEDEWLLAKPVTWVGPQPEEGMDISKFVIPAISNELAQAWKSGPKIDGVRTCSDACEYARKCCTSMIYSNKAESTKDSDKQRLTVSESAGDRKDQRYLDLFIRDHKSDYYGFASGVGPFELQAKLNRMLKFCMGCRTNREMYDETGTDLKHSLSYASSHDVSGWSEFEDRNAQTEFAEYEYRKSKHKFVKEGIVYRDPKKKVQVINKGEIKVVMTFFFAWVQGIANALDTSLHPRYIAFFHHLETKAVNVDSRFAVNSVIDDVVYGGRRRHKPSTADSKHANGSAWTTDDHRAHKRMRLLDFPDWYAELQVRLSDFYIKMARPLENLKSLWGKVRIIFLSDAYIGGAMIPYPLRILIKIDHDEDLTVRTVVGIMESTMGAARAAGPAEAAPKIAYRLGIWMGTAICMNTYGELLEFNSAHLAVWMIAPRDEGGWGVSTYFAFLCGGHADHAVFFRHCMELLQKASGWAPAFDAYAAIVSSPLIPKGASGIIRSFWSIPRDVPNNGINIASTALHGRVWNVTHDSIWDVLGTSGRKGIEYFAERLWICGGYVDGLASKEIADLFPDSLIEQPLTLFTDPQNCDRLFARRDVQFIKRLAARADAKWIKHFKVLFATCGGTGKLQPPIDAYNDTLNVRSFVNGMLPCCNTVFPYTMMTVGYQGEGEAHNTLAFAGVLPSKLHLPHGTSRRDSYVAAGGRWVGMKSSAVDYAPVFEACNVGVVGKKFAHASVLARAYAQMGICCEPLWSLITSLYGSDFRVDALDPLKTATKLKRIFRMTADRDHVTMFHRNAFNASSVKGDILYDFADTYFTAHGKTTVVDPQKCLFDWRVLALDMSWAGGSGGHNFARVAWRLAPINLEYWAYEEHPLFWHIDHDTIHEGSAGFKPKEKPILTEALPFRVPGYAELHKRLVRAEAASGDTGALHGAISEQVDYLSPVYRGVSSALAGKTSSASMHMKIVATGAPQTTNSKNVYISGIIKARILEEANRRNVSVLKMAYSDTILERKESSMEDLANEFRFIYDIRMWDRIWADIQRTIGEEEASAAFSRSFAYIARSAPYTYKCAAHVVDQMHKMPSTILSIVRAAAEGIAGHNIESFSGAFPYLKCITNAGTYNEHMRISFFQRTSSDLMKRYIHIALNAMPGGVIAPDVIDFNLARHIRTLNLNNPDRVVNGFLRNGGRIGIQVRYMTRAIIRGCAVSCKSLYLGAREMAPEAMVVGFMVREFGCSVESVSNDMQVPEAADADDDTRRIYQCVKLCFGDQVDFFNVANAMEIERAYLAEDISVQAYKIYAVHPSEVKYRDRTMAFNCPVSVAVSSNRPDNPAAADIIGLLRNVTREVKEYHYDTESSESDDSEVDGEDQTATAL